MVWEGRSREAPPYPDCATALRVTPPLGLRLKASGMAERFPFGPSTRPEIHPAVSFWAHRHLWLSNAIK